MIIDNKENHHVVGVGFTAYAINGKPPVRHVLALEL